MTSRSGGCISGRTKLFLRGLKTKQLLSQLVPRQIFQIFPTMRWVMGVALVPGFALVFLVPLLNPPHWCLRIAILIISRVDLGCYLCSDKPMLMYMRLYNLYAVYPLYMALSMCDYVCLFLEAPLQGRLRIDDGDVWNANDPHVWTQEEREETQREPCILHTGHGDLELQKKSDVVSWCFMVFHLYLLDRLGISFIFGGVFLWIDD